MIEAPAVEVLLDDEAHLDDLRAAFRVEPGNDRQRLDALVVQKLGVSIREVRRLGVEGRLRVDGRAVLDGFPRLAAGAHVTVLGDGADPAILPERIPLRILHQDADLLVVDKPAGLAMYPGDGWPAGTLANALRGLGRPLSTLEGSLRPGIVHRLDGGTSGTLVVALHDDSHRRLIHEFLTRAVRRRYLALVHGVPPEGTVDAPLARRRAGRKAQAVVDGGRPARTRLTVVARLAGGLSLVEAVPETGRTHQIRVHLAALGCPLVGDTLYGGGDRVRRRAWRALGVRRPMLHAASIEVLGRAAEAPLPADFTRACTPSPPPSPLHPAG